MNLIVALLRRTWSHVHEAAWVLRIGGLARELREDARSWVPVLVMGVWTVVLVALTARVLVASDLSALGFMALLVTVSFLIVALPLTGFVVGLSMRGAGASSGPTVATEHPTPVAAPSVVSVVAVVGLVREGWRLMLAYQRLISAVGDDVLVRRHDSRVRWYRKQVGRILEPASLTVRTFDGELYDVGMCARVENMEDVPRDVPLQVVSTLEPAVLSPEGPLHTGVVEVAPFSSDEVARGEQS